MLFNIIACVLAIVVPLVVGAALLTYVRSALSSVAVRQSDQSSASLVTLTTSYAALAERVNSCETKLAATSSTHLAGELAALQGDLDALSKSCRKQFGRLFAELHHDGALKRNGARQVDVEDGLDPELSAHLAWQAAGTQAAKPNGG